MVHEQRSSVCPVLAGILCLVSLACIAKPAHANLCGQTPSSSHSRQAALLEKENYSDGNDCSQRESCFIGLREYNAQVVACNRKRDSLGDNIDKANSHAFDANLKERIVRGTYNFFGLFSKRYGYKVKRKAGIWTVTSVLEFKFPQQEKTKLHLPIDLIESLSKRENGAPLSDTVCKTAAVDKDDNGLVFHKDDDPSTMSAARACRISRNGKFFLLENTHFWAERFRGKSLTATEWLMHYWRDRIETLWSRPDGSFNLRVQVANLAGRPGEMSRRQLDEMKDVDAHFVVEFHHNVDRWNNMYRPVKVLGIKFYRAIYSGIPEWTIAHEFGHSLGLDDEYPQKDEPKEWRDCDELSGETKNANQRYLMCSARQSAPKSVYYWLITQRFAVGGCDKDGDCAADEYCDKGVAVGIGRNHCAAKKSLGKACTRAVQCSSGRCYVGTCRSEDECSRDSDCTSNEYCDKGTLTIGVNQCVDKKAVGRGCTRAQQCKSGRCRLGVCKPQDECKNDSGCKSNEYCDKGTLTVGVNQCMEKKANGTGCTRAAQCRSGRCYLGFCKGEKECSSDSDCAGDKYCAKGVAGIGKNECKSKKNLGKACSRKGQCESDCCKVYKFKLQCRPPKKCN